MLVAVPSSPATTPPSAVGRRALLKGLGLGGAAALTGLSGCTTGPDPAPASTSSAGPSDPGPADPGPIDAAGVARGLNALPSIIERYLQETTVPGLAFAVVYDGKIAYLEGFGVREVGK